MEELPKVNQLERIPDRLGREGSKEEKARSEAEDGKQEDPAYFRLRELRERCASRHVSPFQGALKLWLKWCWMVQRCFFDRAKGKCPGKVEVIHASP